MQRGIWICKYDIARGSVETIQSFSLSKLGGLQLSEDLSSHLRQITGTIYDLFISSSFFINLLVTTHAVNLFRHTGILIVKELLFVLNADIPLFFSTSVHIQMNNPEKKSI